MSKLILSNDAGARNAMSAQIRREGVILERLDKEKEDGFHTSLFVEWEGSEYYIRMHNGETTKLKRLWKIEE